MPKGSSSSENVHFDFRGMHDTSTSTINSLGSIRSNSNHHQTQTAECSNIGSAKSVALNDREYSNFALGSSKTSILSKFLDTNIANIESEHNNSVAYENLCSGCGYGVFEARGKLCNFCQYVLNGYPYPVDSHNANIYENICDKCSQLYSGDECLVCLEIKNKHNKRKHDNNNVKSTSKKLKKRLFNSLLGSLKRVKSFNSSNSSPPPPQAYINNNNKSPNRKLQIVHNVDGFENVFRTNETFDLNRICELKQQLKASSSDHHIYGKLRKSDDHLHRHPHHQTTPYECIKQKSQSDDYLISATDRDPQSRSTSIKSHDSLDNNSSSYLHLTTTLHNSVSEWMTSLRCETHDYYSFGAPDTVLSNPKSIPGNFTEFGSSSSPSPSSSFVISPRNVVYTATATAYDRDDEMQSAHATTKLRSFSDESSQAEFAQQMVNEFKRNLMEKPGSRSAAQQHLLRTKRQGIYLKLNNTIETNRQRAENNYNHQVDDDDYGNGNGNGNDDLVVMVGDHQQRNDRNCLLQSSAQAQVVGTETDLAPPTGAGLNISRRRPEHQSTNKRCCIYEKDSDFVSDILQAFDSFLLRESDISPPTSSHSSFSPPSPPLSPSSASASAVRQEFDVKNCEKLQVSDEIWLDIAQQTTSGSINIYACVVLPHQIDLEHIVHDLVLSKSLNKIVITYEFPLKLFLSGVDKSAHLSQFTFPTLKKIFRRFRVFLFKQKQNVQIQMSVVSSDQASSQASLLGSERIPAIEYSGSSVVDEHRVPRPSSSTPSSPEADSLNSIKMTVPNNGISNTKAKEEDENEEEPIYQPIWKFKTVGEAQETDYITDVYYDHDDNHLPRRCDSSNYLAEGADIEDLDEWEPDDEFTFTTKLAGRSGSVSGSGSGSSNKEGDTISVNTIQSSSGSTITGYASSISTMTLASTTSSSNGGGGGVGSSVTHHILRNICIFYSPKDPKIRAVLYEYDRNRCSSYFAQQMPSSSSSSLSPPPLPPTALSSIKETGRGGSNGSTSTPTPTETASADYYDTRRSPCDRNKSTKNSSESGGQILADSVQAWKYLLLDVNYLEDEEDMIVAESQILRAQTIKEMDSPLPPIGILQRFKSISSGNLLDVPAEEDKKSITERVRNKLQRGVFKLHPRSPKEGKKSRNFFRRNEATSLYLEDGMKPKYPIFKAPLESLEMNEASYPYVPRFVVDCIEYIEQKDCIQMDGLYRASGNKVAIDELKQKLTESYIYDPKLLVTDDIHTLTSLLKMFFRELASPLIPQDTYKRLAATRNLMEPSAIENMKIAFQEMKNPNRDTLKFLIKHLTTVAHYSSENRMPASNLAIVWGPCILSANQIEFDIARMNTIAKVLIENYDRIFGDNERLVS